MLPMLSSLSEFQRPLVGDKAMNLALLQQQGYRVPDGFVLDSATFRYVVMQNRNSDRMLSVASNQVPRQVDEIDRFSVNMARDIIDLDFPEDLLADIRQAWQEMGSPAVIVRPSAVGHTVPSSNQSGRPRGTANIDDFDSILLAIKLAWVSLWSREAILYRQRVGLPSDGLSIAVIIQRFVPGRVSGLLYTANPRTNRTDQLVIRSVWGLGETIVRDEVRPDHWVFDSSGAVFQASIMLKDSMRQPAPAQLGQSGTELVATPSHQLNMATLENEEISQLLSLALQTTRLFPEQPQLLEWTYADQQLYVLQVRPISSMFPRIPSAATAAQQGLGPRLYLQFNALLGSYAPMSTLGSEIWIRLLMQVMSRLARYKPEKNPAWLKMSGNRIWIDITNQLIKDSHRRFLNKLVERQLPGASQMIARASEEHRSSFRKSGPTLGDPRLSMLFRTGFQGYFNPTRAAYQHKRSGEDTLRRMDIGAQKVNTLADALGWLEESISLLGQMLVEQFALQLPGLNAWEWIADCVKKWPSIPVSINALRQPQFTNPSNDIARQVYLAAAFLYAGNKEFETEQGDIQQLFANIGFLADQDMDPASPRWAEDDLLLDQFTELYKTSLVNPEHLFFSLRDQSKLLGDILPKMAEKNGNIFTAWEMDRFIQTAKALAGLGQMTQSYMAKAMTMVRHVFLKAGSQLIVQRHLDEPDDIFFLSSDDLRGSIGSLNETAAKNRLSYESETLRAVVPVLMLSNGEAFYPEATDLSIGEIAGLSLLPGEYSGYIRVIDSEESLAYADRGEIFVFRDVQPQWAEKLLLAGALVLETEDRGSYGAEIGRILGVPSVFAVPFATQRLQTGMTARVQGDTGLITILSAPAPDLPEPDLSILDELEKTSAAAEVADQSAGS